MTTGLELIEGARLAALVGFAVAGLWTPGPNNILLARSGATFGFRRTVPHALGVALGFPIMLFAVAFGLGEIFRFEPVLREGVRAAGIAVLLYLSWKIATSRWKKTEGAAGRPFRFYEAVAFQWINPKAWVMAIGASAAFVTGGAPALESALCAVVFAAVGLSSAASWTAFGTAISRKLHTEARRRAFGVVMGILLAASAVGLVFQDMTAFGI